MRSMALVPAAAGVFSDVEEDFFRDGPTDQSDEDVETWEDLDAGYVPTRLWDRLFKKPLRAGTEPPLPPLATVPHVTPRTPSASAPPPVPTRARTPVRVLNDDEEEWEWQIAIARARASAND